jgi:hypothetical protein
MSRLRMEIHKRNGTIGEVGCAEAVMLTLAHMDPGFAKKFFYPDADNYPVEAETERY